MSESCRDRLHCDFLLRCRAYVAVFFGVSGMSLPLSRQIR